MNPTAIPKPDPKKPPMKANLFETARQANTQLLPLFPYIGPGDIVPCSASMRSAGGHNQIGYFLHTNSVDEVAISFGSTGRIRTGDVWCGPRTHGVGGDSSEPFFALMCITQRQREEGSGQPETVAIQCEKCNTELARHEFEGVEADADSRIPPLPTTVGSLAAAQKYNETPEVRRCPNCGHDNPPFPLHIWGWGRYVMNTGIAEDAWTALNEAAR
jgi:hypothetical protein